MSALADNKRQLLRCKLDWLHHSIAMQSPDPRLTDDSQDTMAQSDVISKPAPGDGRPKPSRTLVALAALLILFLSSLAVLVIHKSSGAKRGPLVSVQKAAATHTIRLKGTPEAINPTPF